MGLQLLRIVDMQTKFGQTLVEPNTLHQGEKLSTEVFFIFCSSGKLNFNPVAQI